MLARPPNAEFKDLTFLAKAIEPRPTRKYEGKMNIASAYFHNGLLDFPSSPVLHAFAASKKHIVTGCMNSDGYDHGKVPITQTLNCLYNCKRQLLTLNFHSQCFIFR